MFSSVAARIIRTAISARLAAMILLKGGTSQVYFWDAIVVVWLVPAEEWRDVSIVERYCCLERRDDGETKDVATGVDAAKRRNIWIRFMIEFTIRSSVVLIPDINRECSICMYVCVVGQGTVQLSSNFSPDFLFSFFPSYNTEHFYLLRTDPNYSLTLDQARRKVKVKVEKKDERASEMTSLACCQTHIIKTCLSNGKT